MLNVAWSLCFLTYSAALHSSSKSATSTLLLIRDTGTPNFNVSTGQARWVNPGPPACSEDQWAKYKCKGTTLLNMMKTDNAGAGKLFTPQLESAASKFVDFPESFTRWGYTTSSDPGSLCDMSEYRFGMKKALEGLGIATEYQKWKCWNIVHGSSYGTVPMNEQTYEVDGKEYRFTIAMNKESGVIMIASSYSPGNEAQHREPPVTELPELQRAADIIWGQWKVHAMDQAANLRYIIRWNIVNKDTPGVIRRALDSKGENFPLEEWPGTHFTMEADEGKALLGTPNGVGVGYLLVQHKNELGENIGVTGVDVFAREKVVLFPQTQPCLVFHIEKLTA